MKLLRSVANTLGANRLARELDVAIVPLGGYSRATYIEPFRWLNEHFLKESVQEWVVLDRDYRSEQETRNTEAEFANLGVKCHVWKKKELESYMLAPRAVSRLAGVSAEWVVEELEEIAVEMKTRVQSALANARQGRERDQSRREQILYGALADFDTLWSHEEGRLDLCPAKEVLSQLNQRLQASGKKAVSAVAIARELREDEIPREMATVVRQIEDDILIGEV
jgi:hypothetical protein